jgi:cell division protein FtsA
MNAVENQSKVVVEEEIVEQPTETISDAETSIDDDTEHTNTSAPIQSEPKKERKSIFEKWADKLKDFLDNAE